MPPEFYTFWMKTFSLSYSLSSKLKLKSISGLQAQFSLVLVDMALIDSGSDLIDLVLAPFALAHAQLSQINCFQIYHSHA